MKLHQLQSLVALVDSGSIRGAARTLSLTQPTVSARIAELEQEVGVALVNRTARGTTLTSAGRTLLERARVIANEVRRAEEEISLIARDGATTLAIGSSPLATMELVGPLVGAFHALYPRVNVRIAEGLFKTTAMSLREGLLDMVVAPIPVTPEEHKNLQFEELVAYPMYVVARTGHPLKQKARRLDDLADAKWIVGASTSERQSTVEELFTQYGKPKPTVVVESDSFTSVQTIIASSDLLGLLPYELYASLNGQPVAPLRIEEAIRPVRVGLILRAGEPLSPGGQAFANLIRKQAALAVRKAASRRREVA
jgi:LysR family transcriptional regulator of abg operon